MGYLLLTNFSNFYGSIHSYSSSITFNVLEKYFGKIIFALVSSGLLFVWTCINVILYFKKNVFFINSFVYICLFFGLIKAIYFLVFNFNSNSPVFFDYFHRVKSVDLVQEFLLMIVFFLVAIIARKHFTLSDNTIYKG